MADRRHLWEDVTTNGSARKRVEGFFDELFKQRKSDLLKDSRGELKVERIELYQFLWAESQLLWEERTMELRHMTSSQSPTPERHMPSLAEHDPWALTMSAAPADFREGEDTASIPASIFVEACAVCGGDGQVPCPDCGGQGHNTCHKCQGARTVPCEKCGGDGEVPCRKCDGKGYTAKLVKETAPDGSTQTVEKQTVCPECNGSGKDVCGKCKGAGKLACPTCHGDGALECGHCHGKGTLTCEDCEGKGAFLHDVLVRQNYRVERQVGLCSNLKGLLDLYPDCEIEPKGQSQPLQSQIGEGALAGVAGLDTLYPADEVAQLAWADAVPRLLTGLRQGKDHILRQSLALCAKPLYHVTYAFRGEGYHVLLDPEGECCFFDKHPFHNLFQSQKKELESLYAARDFRALHKGAKDALKLSRQNEEFAPYAAAYRKTLRKAHRGFLLWAALGSLLTWLLVSLILYFVWGGAVAPALFLIPLGVSLGADLILSPLWRWMPWCKDQFTYRVSALSTGAAVGIIVTLLCGLLALAPKK